MKKNQKSPRGITLVALVITIIVLLILAGISIQALTNQGIFGRASEAKKEAEIASIKEKIALDIYENQLEPPLGSITEEQLETILGKYGTVNKGEDGTIIGITTEEGYEILLKDIYGGETVAESVPDGAIVNPVNDITTWLKTGGISRQYSYTTIEQVIADSTCTESLMNNENAMKYLVRSTEFANAICASETAMTSLGQSAFVDDTVLNSYMWVSAISSSNYYELIYDPINVHSSSSATISFNSKSFTSDATGNTSKVIPWGTFTFSDSISGQSYERTVDRNTTDLYVMPEGALYWYGNECEWITGGWLLNENRTLYKSETVGDPNWISAGSQYATATKNLNNIYLKSGIEATTKYACAGMSNVIDTSNYNKVKFTLNIVQTRQSESGINFRCVSVSEQLKLLNFGVASQTESTYEIDIFDFSSCAFDFLAASIGSSYTEYYINEVWTE